MSVLDRISVRTYQKKLLETKDVEFVKEVLSKASHIEGPFHHSFDFFLHMQETLEDETKKVGTYGYITNGFAFIGASIPKDARALVDYGYVFEKIILQLHEAGFGTCWLGGTFDRNDFSVYKKDNEIIPAISPVGYPKSQSLKEKALRMVVGSNKRISFDKFIFIKDFNHPYQESDQISELTNLGLQYLQAAPSASNKQPWRVIVEANRIHLYLEKTPNYGVNLGFSIQHLDMGIALSHFETAFLENNQKVKYVYDAFFEDAKKEYIVSVTF